MPRPARRSKSRRSGWDAEIVQHLYEGDCLSCATNQPNHDGDDLRQAWEELRDVILPEFVSAHPGKRPWAFWAYDLAGQRRERIDGKPHPFDNAARTLHVAKSSSEEVWKRAYRLHFGLPAIYISPFDRDLYEDFMKNGLQGGETEIFEPEWSFLQRHGLLVAEDSP